MIRYRCSVWVETFDDNYNPIECKFYGFRDSGSCIFRDEDDFWFWITRTIQEDIKQDTGILNTTITSGPISQIKQ